MVALKSSINILSVILTFTVIYVATDEVCYEKVGCFNDGWPFVSLQRPISYLPWSPANISTEFWLYTRFNKWSYDSLSYNDPQTIQDSHFRALRQTKFIVHGFVSDGSTGWVKKLKDSLLEAEDTNVIVVNWKNGANPGLVYGQAAANTRVVGVEISLLIKSLQVATGILNSQFHIIGHSLGAHIAGYAGERTRNLGRITGLDPAGPFFEGTDTAVRLDPTDAQYVDAIHSDGKSFWELGWGMIEPVGHADFYPNGGVNQPGCPGNKEEEGNWWEVTCNHGRASVLLIDSILNSNTPMIGYPCQNYEAFIGGECNSCESLNCARMGYYSDLDANSGNPVKYYLKTRSEEPFSVDVN